MRSKVVMIVTALSLVVPAWAGEKTLRGVVLYGLQPVRNVSISLVESTPGLTFVHPSQAKHLTDEAGRFEISDIDQSKRYTLIVWDPWRKGQINTQVNDLDSPDLRVFLKRLITINEPREHSYLSQTIIRIRWTPLSEATNYRVQVLDKKHKVHVNKDTTIPTLEVSLPAGAWYSVRLEAYDQNGNEIGSDIVYEGAPLYFGVADPKYEQDIQPAIGTCRIQAKIPNFFIVPERSELTDAPFLVEEGDTVRILGKREQWYKVELSTGYFPGRIGWVRVVDVQCTK